MKKGKSFWLGALLLLLGVGIIAFPDTLKAIGLGAIAMPGETVGVANVTVQWANMVVAPNYDMSFYGGADADYIGGNPELLLLVDGKEVSRSSMSKYCGNFHCQQVLGLQPFEATKILRKVSHASLQAMGILPGKHTIDAYYVQYDNKYVCKQEACGDGVTQDMLNRGICQRGTSTDGVYLCTNSGDEYIIRKDFITQTEMWMDNSNCVLQPGYFWVVEQFSAGQTVSLKGGAGSSALRFISSGFCSQRPILVYEMGKVVSQKLEEYSLLQRNYITIPAGQLWEISYLVKENDAPNVMIDCGSDGVYNASENVCVKTPTVVYPCKGTWDSAEKVCVVQTEKRCTESNATYDSSTEKCYLSVEAETETICPGGSSLIVNETGIKKCVFEPEIVCEGKLDYSTEPAKCLVLPETEIVSTGLLAPIQNNKGFLLGILLIIAGGFLVLRVT